MYARACVRNLQLLVTFFEKSNPLEAKRCFRKSDGTPGSLEVFDPVVKTTGKLFTFPFKHPINGPCSFESLSRRSLMTSPLGDSALLPPAGWSVSYNIVFHLFLFDSWRMKVKFWHKQFHETSRNSNIKRNKKESKGKSLDKSPWSKPGWTSLIRINYLQSQTADSWFHCRLL